MAKRKTKAQREQEQKDALRVRLGDMMAAVQGEIPEESDGDSLFLENYPAIRNAVKLCLMAKDFWDMKENEHLTAPYNADQFTTVDKLTEFLYRNGVRA